jgi:hypothetical protein
LFGGNIQHSIRHCLMHGGCLVGFEINRKVFLYKKLNSKTALSCSETETETRKPHETTTYSVRKWGAHSQAIGVKDKKMACALQQSKWASMFYQVMLSRTNIATTSKNQFPRNLYFIIHMNTYLFY